MATPETASREARARDTDLASRAPGLHRVTSPGAIGLLSARCCGEDASALDGPLLDNLSAAMAEAGVEAELHVETLTDLQRELAGAGRLDDARRALAGQIGLLFATRRLGAFPLLLIGGRVASAGRVPPTGELVEKLRRFEAGEADAPAGE